MADNNALKLRLDLDERFMKVTLLGALNRGIFSINA